MRLDFHVKDAVSTSLSCDKRKTRFALHFRASGKHLHVMTGTLAVNQHISTVHAPGADSYKQAALQCQLHAAPPKKPPAPAGTTGMSDDKVNEADALHVVAKVEHCVADKGYDVQLAGRELATGMLVSGPSPKHLSDVIAQRLALREGGEQRPVSCCAEVPEIESNDLCNSGL